MCLLTIRCSLPRRRRDIQFMVIESVIAPFRDVNQLTTEFLLTVSVPLDESIMFQILSDYLSIRDLNFPRM
jgi:hypothetical protein